jgi:hypothetical protein
MLQLLRGAASQRHSLALHRESTDRRKATEREAEQVKFNTRHPQFQAQSLFKDSILSLLSSIDWGPEVGSLRLNSF